ncbi:MAG: tripartite tricarboxylate transporter substrate binding protein [Betaproteobacteria bacterium]|nr:tripartite tricarboxylate transporter substrate binding protein [Betaproteobacteria bacterium]MBI2961624.1 tripartite tricarboxylate transporter substrate binding protein [Betaproteobacteria bacterium]
MKKIFAVLAAILAASALQALAQGYPARPVRTIITFVPGTATDIVGRVVMQKVSEYWGQPVIAENRAGAGGSIASAVVAKAAPDGYTLLIDSSAHAVSPWMYAKLPYDTLKDFVDVSPFAAQPNVLVVSSASRIKTVAEFVAEAKAKAGQMTVGSAGIGTGTHLNLEKFKLATAIDAVHVPYKGTPEVLTDIFGGRVTAYFGPISAVLSAIRDGKLRAIAVSSARRNNSLPEVPAIAEAVAGFEFTLWFGLWAPAATPADVVTKISADVRRALESAEVKERLARLGNDTMIMTPAEFSAFVRRELADYAKIIKAAGIKPQ